MTTRKTPTDAMLNFARRIAARKNEELPPKVEADFDACRTYLDAATKPTEKQLAFAERIAKAIGQRLPDELRNDGMKLSRWIDENRDSLPPRADGNTGKSGAGKSKRG